MQFHDICNSHTEKSNIYEKMYQEIPKFNRSGPRISKRNPSKMVGVTRGHQRSDTLKPYSQKLVNLITLGPQFCLTQGN